MNRERLLRLAGALEADATNPKGIRFDLSYWATTHNGVDTLDYRQAYESFQPGDKIPLDCGTAACAMGFAAISGIFAPDGLSYEITPCYGLVPVYQKGTLSEMSGFSAAQALFGISYHDALVLFSSERYVDTEGADAEREVVRRLRELATTGKITGVWYDGHIVKPEDGPEDEPSPDLVGDGADQVTDGPDLGPIDPIEEQDMD